MAMTYTSLTAAKGTSGALATWVDYTKLDVPVTVDEAQTLLFTILRCREMKKDYSFTMPVNGAFIALPTRFLDPIGRIYQPSLMQSIRHKDSQFVQRAMNYNETNGSLGTNPFATTSGPSVNVTLASHGFTQNSVFYTTGAALFNGVTISGTFPVTAIVDANTFTIDITQLGTTPTGTGAGGGASVTYTCDILQPGVPVWYGVWNENLYFDTAFSQLTVCKLQYYESPLLLSATNQTNFLTNRYPHLLRTACEAAASDFMKDDTEYQKHYQRLLAAVERVNIENDMFMRGMELDTEIP